jgi:hypothetical protein
MQIFTSTKEEEPVQNRRRSYGGILFPHHLSNNPLLHASLFGNCRDVVELTMKVIVLASLLASAAAFAPASQTGMFTTSHRRLE